jgi:pilus assembly protein Flp/PilA
MRQYSIFHIIFFKANQMNKFLNSIRSFVQDEEGAQVIEYALIIAVVSIALVLALQGLTTGGYFQAFIDRVDACLTTATCV